MTPAEPDTGPDIAKAQTACARIEKARRAEQAAIRDRDSTLRVLYAAGMKPPAIARQVGLGVSLVRYVVCRADARPPGA